MTGLTVIYEKVLTEKERILVRDMKDSETQLFLLAKILDSIQDMKENQENSE